MSVKRKLFNPHNKIFEVIFEDDVSVSGNYEIINIIEGGCFYFEVILNIYEDNFINNIMDNVDYYVTIAKSTMTEFLLSKIKLLIEKNM